MDLLKLYQKKKKELNERIIKNLFSQILNGVYLLHQKDIIHRDLKPENILINNQGIVKLADFGLARELPKDESLLMTKNVCTIWYRSPELLYGCSQYGKEIDIWSLGCILAELLQKLPVFSALGQITMLCQITECLGLIDVINI